MIVKLLLIFDIIQSILSGTIPVVKSSDQYIAIEKGTPNSQNYRLYYTNQYGYALSPMHDIPLYANKNANGSQSNVYNMIVEIPRWTNAKMEITLTEPLNPIKQDIKNGKLRYVANCFPYHGYIWNYGAFPQTWENPEHTDPSTGCKGDNDPIDVLEIGSKIAKRSEIQQVKILGIMALIDEGETDWKVITINVNDPKADKMNDIADVEQMFPGLLNATIEWFKIYKIPDGKSINNFAFNGEAKNAKFAIEIVNKTHYFWQSLIKNKIDTNINIARINTAVIDSPFIISQSEADQIVSSVADDGVAEPIPDNLDTWYYITL